MTCWGEYVLTQWTPVWKTGSVASPAFISKVIYDIIKKNAAAIDARETREPR